MAVLNQRSVNGDLDHSVLRTTAGVYLCDRFLACKDKTVLPGLGIFHSAIGPGTATIHTFRDLVDQLVEIPLPFILYGLQLISGKRDTA